MEHFATENKLQKIIFSKTVLNPFFEFDGIEMVQGVYLTI